MATAGLALATSVAAPVAVPAATPPQVTVSVPAEQHLLREHGAVAFVRCDRPCRARVGGTVTVGGTDFALERASVDTGRKAKRVVLPLSAAAARALRAAHADDRPTEVEVRVRVRAVTARR